MRIANLLKWAIIGFMMAVFVSFDAEPVNAASAAKNPSLTQQDKPLKRHRNNHRKHRRHRRWKRHHHRKMDTNIEKKMPPKNENK
jgi:hypothetical protein